METRGIVHPLRAQIQDKVGVGVLGLPGVHSVSTRLSCVSIPWVSGFQDDKEVARMPGPWVGLRLAYPRTHCSHAHAHAVPLSAYRHDKAQDDDNGHGPFRTCSYLLRRLSDMMAVPSVRHSIRQV